MCGCRWTERLYSDRAAGHQPLHTRRNSRGLKMIKTASPERCGAAKLCKRPLVPWCSCKYATADVRPRGPYTDLPSAGSHTPRAVGTRPSRHAIPRHLDVPLDTAGGVRPQGYLPGMPWRRHVGRCAAFGGWVADGRCARANTHRCILTWCHTVPEDVLRGRPRRAVLVCTLEPLSLGVDGRRSMPGVIS